MNITNMLKKDHQIKSIVEVKKPFNNIKKAILEAPVVVIACFDKDILVFTYASEYTIAVVLLQKNDQGEEQPISFFSNVLRGGDLKYDIMENKHML